MSKEIKIVHNDDIYIEKRKELSSSLKKLQYESEIMLQELNDLLTIINRILKED